ncbi:lysylphosphatidylglycerol synthase transmembrane domain-containing protein [Verrucomicrobiota bacterium]
MKKKILPLVQFLIGIGLLSLIFKNIGDKGDMLDAMRSAGKHWFLLSIGVLCFGFCICIVTLRWKILLDSQGLKLPFRRLMALYYVGQFFNAFLFGATGGDLVKAYFITKEAPEKKTAAVGTVLIDRIIGLIALVLLTVTVMLCRLNFFLSNPIAKTAFILTVALLFVVLGGVFVVFQKKFFEKWSLFRKLEDSKMIGGIISKLYDAFHLCITDYAVLFKTLSLSLLNHVSVIVLSFCLGLALEIDLGFIAYLSLFPIINAIGALPITPGGIGTREAAAVYFFGLVGVAETRALTLSLLVYASMMFWSVVGGVVYFFYIYKSGKSMPRNA